MGNTGKDNILEIVGTTLAQCRAALVQKAKEYAPGLDRLGAFKRISTICGGNITPETVARILHCKHIESIGSIINELEGGAIPEPALIDEKIMDAINYVVLRYSLQRNKLQGYNIYKYETVDADVDIIFNSINKYVLYIRNPLGDYNNIIRRCEEGLATGRNNILQGEKNIELSGSDIASYYIAVFLAVKWEMYEYIKRGEIDEGDYEFSVMKFGRVTDGINNHDYYMIEIDSVSELEGT